MSARSFLPSMWNRREAADLPFNSLQREIDRVFSDFASGANWPFGATRDRGGWLSPSMDIKETETGIEITTELPGVDQNDVDVSITDQVLTIKGEKKSESEEGEDDKGVRRVVERSYGAFMRSVSLPFPVEMDKVKATFDKGVLKICMTKPAEVATKTQKIAVTGG